MEPNKKFGYTMKIVLTQKSSIQPQYKSVAFNFLLLLSKWTCRFKVHFKRDYICLPNLVF